MLSSSFVTSWSESPYGSVADIPTTDLLRCAVEIDLGNFKFADGAKGVREQDELAELVAGGQTAIMCVSAERAPVPSHRCHNILDVPSC